MPVYRIAARELGRLHVRAWRRRALRTVGLLFLTLVACMGGLILLDPSSAPRSTKWFLALWNSMNLITTVGDFSQFTTAQRVFVIMVMLSVVTIGGYAVASLTGFFSSELVLIYRENLHMERTLEHLTDHVVVVGFGPVGRLVAQRLKEAGERVVVIDRDAALAAQASHLGHLVVHGDLGVDAEVLQLANVARARALAVTNADVDGKLSITLMAHAIKPTLQIVVTGFDDPRGALLEHAGASDVVLVDDLVASAVMSRLGAAATT